MSHSTVDKSESLGQSRKNCLSTESYCHPCVRNPVCVFWSGWGCETPLAMEFPLVYLQPFFRSLSRLRWLNILQLDFSSRKWVCQEQTSTRSSHPHGFIAEFWQQPSTTIVLESFTRIKERGGFLSNSFHELFLYKQHYGKNSTRETAKEEKLFLRSQSQQLHKMNYPKTQCDTTKKKFMRGRGEGK